MMTRVTDETIIMEIVGILKDYLVRLKGRKRHHIV